MLRRLAVVVALALFASQTLAVQHLHADGMEQSCVLCAIGQHDAAPLPAAVACPAATPLSAAPVVAAVPPARALPRTRPPARASPRR